MSDKLTPTKEAFALKFVECNNASQAYRTVCNVGKNTKQESIWQGASKMLADPKVLSRVEELQAEARERSLVTMESITKELEESRIVASLGANSAAMTSAIMGKAKVNGLLVDKSDVNVTGDISFNTVYQEKPK